MNSFYDQNYIKLSTIIYYLKGIDLSYFMVKTKIKNIFFKKSYSGLSKVINVLLDNQHRVLKIHFFLNIF